MQTEGKKFTCIGSDKPSFVRISSTRFGFASQFNSKSMVIPDSSSSIIETPKYIIHAGGFSVVIKLQVMAGVFTK